MTRAGWRLSALAAALCLVAALPGRAAADDPCRIEISGLARPAVDHPLLRTAYALVRGNEEVPVYAAPAEAQNGLAPLRFLPAGAVGVSLEQAGPLVVEGEAWHQINPGEYVRAEALEPVAPSTHQGVLVPPALDGIFAWVLFNSRVVSAPGEKPGEEAPFLPERSLVHVHEIVEANGEKWCRIGCGGWLPYRRLGLVIPRQRPEGVAPDERWLDISLNEQTLAAYEGNRMRFATLISTGNSRFPTVQGEYRISFKAARRKMSGGVAGEDLYFLEDVPWQMYFHEGYALHGSYWHDLFGLPTSHGCINLAPKDALWLFGWASVPMGTTAAGRPSPATLLSIHE